MFDRGAVEPALEDIRDEDRVSKRCLGEYVRTVGARNAIGMFDF
jgi:hypothetical protein